VAGALTHERRMLRFGGRRLAEREGVIKTVLLPLAEFYRQPPSLSVFCQLAAIAIGVHSRWIAVCCGFCRRDGTRNGTRRERIERPSPATVTERGLPPLLRIVEHDLLRVELVGIKAPTGPLEQCEVLRMFGIPDGAEEFCVAMHAQSSGGHFRAPETHLGYAARDSVATAPSYRTT
jgi:hypothetical protein